MPSISAPSDLAGDAVRVWHYDGASGLKREPLLVPAGDGFTLVEDGMGGERHAFADLLARDSVDGDTIYGLKGRIGWRIGFAGAVPPAIAARIARPSRYGAIIDRIGLWPAVGVSAVLAAGAIALFVMTPAFVARAVPPSVERQLGEVMAGDFGNQACDGPGGGEALAALVSRIAPDDRLIEVRVVNLPIVNAVTLPGGKIVLFDGLVKAAASPDEVAGVLAHEIGHVHHRDVMEALLRQVGLSVLLGGLDGNVGGYTNALLSSAYSRRAEEGADSYAIDVLKRAEVSPLPLAAFFNRLAKMEGPSKGAFRVTTYFASHPVTSDRARRFVTSARTHRGDRPVLDAQAWTRLRTICSSDPDVKKVGFHF